MEAQQQGPIKLTYEQILHLVSTPEFTFTATTRRDLDDLLTRQDHHIIDLKVSIECRIDDEEFARFVNFVYAAGGIDALSLRYAAQPRHASREDCYKKLLESVTSLEFWSYRNDDLSVLLPAVFEVNSGNPKCKVRNLTLPFTPRLVNAVKSLPSLESLRLTGVPGAESPFPNWLLHGSDLGMGSIWDLCIDISGGDHVDMELWVHAFTALLRDRGSGFKSLRLKNDSLSDAFVRALSDDSVHCKLQHLELFQPDGSRLWDLELESRVDIVSLHIVSNEFPPHRALGKLQVTHFCLQLLKEHDACTASMFITMVSDGLRHLFLAEHAKVLLPSVAEQRKLVDYLDSNLGCSLESIHGLNWKDESLKLNCTEILKRNKVYREAGLLDEGQMQPSTVKLFICGDARVGKSTLRKNLIRQTYLPSCLQFSRSTYGIMLQALKFGDKKLLICDLAGQPEFHTFHHYFVRGSDKDLFLLVCKAPKHDFEVLETQLRYWLRFIVAHRSLSEHKPRVFIVVNYFPDSKKPSEFNSTRKEHSSTMCEVVTREYSDHVTFEGIHGVNVTKYEDTQLIKHDLGVALKGLIESRPKVPIVCKHILQKMQQAEETRSRGAAARRKVLSFEEFKSLCGIKSFKDDLFKACITHLHDSGDVVYFEQEKTGDKDQFIIVDVQWFLRTLIGIFLPRRERSFGNHPVHVNDTRSTSAVRMEIGTMCHADHVDYILLCLQNMGVTLQDRVRDAVTILPLLKNKLGSWEHEVDGTTYSFWGRRFDCKDSAQRLLPFGIFNMLQVKLATMFSRNRIGDGWLYLVENRIHAIVRIGGTRDQWYDKHWIDVLVRIPFDPNNFLLETGEALFLDVKRCIFQLCGATNWGCPSLELEEKVIGPRVVETHPDSTFGNVCELSKVLDKVKDEGLWYNYTWPANETTPAFQLLFPSEKDVYLSEQKDALRNIEIEVDNCLPRVDDTQVQVAVDDENCSRLSYGHVQILRQMKKMNQRLETVISNIHLQGVNIMTRLQLHLEFEAPKYPYLTNEANFLQTVSTLAFGTTSRLHFMCEHNGGSHPVENQKGIQIRATPEWFRKAAPVLIPALRVAFFALKIVGIAGLGVIIPTPASSFPTGLKEKTIDAVLEKVFLNIDNHMKSIHPSTNDFHVLNEFLKGRDLEDELGLQRTIQNGKHVWLCHQHR